MKRILLALVVLSLAATPLLAAPTWSAQTYQMFDFLPGDMTSSTDNGDGTFTYEFDATDDQNPFGEPGAIIIVTPGQYSDDGYYESGYFYGAEIYVGSGMVIPNQPVANPLKRIRVEIVFEPQLVKWDVTVPSPDPYVVNELFATIPDTENVWDRAIIEWEIRPNPPEEVLWFTFEDQGTGLKSIEVWTACVPAPGAILLGGIGVGLVGWIRRRKML